MSNRLDLITTKTGDDGTTGLADGSRLLKSSPRIHAIGEVDELNVEIGILFQTIQSVFSTVALEAPLQAALDQILKLLENLQHLMFELGSELAVPGLIYIKATHLEMLENWTTQTNAQLPALKEFILPNGSICACQAHKCRATARRAERVLVALDQVEPLSPLSKQILNRCSDLFFVMARELNRVQAIPDVFWSNQH